MKIDFAGTEAILTPEGALWLPRFGLLCAADLHFEKGSFFRRTATFLPPYDTAETLDKLEHMLRRLKPAIFIAAGDSFHDRDAAQRMTPEAITTLNRLVDSVGEWHWLTGNHDAVHPAGINGKTGSEFVFNDIIFRHRTLCRDEIEVTGHYHPKARMRLRGHSITAPCFVRHRNRIILPSFGAYTGGLDIGDAAFLAVAPKEERDIFLVYGDEVFHAAEKR